jgi:hypothetical protein
MSMTWLWSKDAMLAMVFFMVASSCKQPLGSEPPYDLTNGQSLHLVGSDTSGWCELVHSFASGLDGMFSSLSHLGTDAANVNAYGRARTADELCGDAVQHLILTVKRVNSLEGCGCW